MDPKFLLWEVLPEKKYSIIDHQHLNKGFHTISFERDNNYRLICKLEGRIEDKSPSPTRKVKRGQSIKMDGIIKAQDPTASTKIDIERIYTKKENTQGSGLYSADAEASSIRVYHEVEDEFKFIIYWFLNGQDSAQFGYTRVRTIELRSEATIEISDLTREKVRIHETKSSTINSIQLSLNSKKFLFGFVDEKETGKYRGSYLRFDKNFFPTQAELEAIQFALSFILGRALIPIGSTKYNYSLLPVERVYKSTHRSDIEQVIRSVSIPPIRTDMLTVTKSKDNFEEKMNYLLNKYYEYEVTFQLNQIIWYMSYGRILPTDMQLQPLSTALDLFQKAWFRSDKSDSKGKYLMDNDYEETISKYIPSIKNDLRERETAAPILNKIKKCNEMSLNEKYETLFKEIKLKTGEVERISIRERNLAIHGSLKPKDYDKLYIRTLAFQTLLHRLILKLLEYNGKYNDYSTSGFPERDINEPLQGPEGGGRI